jgi:hypothetical protein
MDLEEATFSEPVKKTAEKHMKRTNNISHKEEQVFAINKEESKQTIFDCGLANNFRSTSPPFRVHENKAFTDLKVKQEINEKSNF